MSWQQVFADNFNRANSTTVGNGWSQHQSPATGTYGINNNQLVSLGTRTFIVRRPCGTTGVAAEVDVVDDGSTFTLSFATGDSMDNTWTPGSGYEIVCRELANSGNVLIRRRDPSLLTLATVNYGDWNGKRVRFERLGNKLTVYVNGTQIAQVTDSTYMTDSDTNEYGFRLEMNTQASPSSRLNTRMDNVSLQEFATAPEPTFRPRRQRIAALGGF